MLLPEQEMPNSSLNTVDFLLAGAQKSGTSALDFYLRQHPEICMANKKEVHFFDNESFFLDQHIDYSRYHQFFPDFYEQNLKLRGEATPIYMYWKEAPRRIFNYNPNMKFILILRNPIERAFSHWNMERSRNAEQLNFWDAITLEVERCKETYPLQHRVYSYLDRGFYTEQLERLWRWFPKKNIFIIHYDELKNQPESTLKQLYSFLAVKPIPFLGEEKVFMIPYERVMTSQEHNFLLTVFKDEIIKLEQLLNWDCSHWIRET